MKPRIDAKITLVLREKDVNFLHKALQYFRAKGKDEAHERAYLLEVLELLTTPE
jgi:hypothetical protein